MAPRASVSSTSDRRGRVSVLASWQFDGWKLPRFESSNERVWIHGGERTLLELGAAAALAGFAVELRGTFLEREVAAIERAAGVRLGRPEELRAPHMCDTLILPEGSADPLQFARAALSPARAVVVMLAAPGVFGWSFDRDGRPPDVMTLDPSTVGRPEQLEAARRSGLEVWTNLAVIAAQAQSLGIPHHYLGVGRPVPYPEPASKRVDVATLADNRWADLARQAVARLRLGVSRIELPALPHEQLLEELGAARIFIHPARIEGRSRLGEEARAMGTVPILLSSNHVGEGADARAGGVAVGSLEEIAPAVHALLDDPDQLRELSQTGYRVARKLGDWRAFVDRVAGALAMADHEVARFAPGRAALGASLASREQALAASHAEREQALAASHAERERALAASHAERERALIDELSGARIREQELVVAFATAERRYRALRGRKAVRAALGVAGALQRMRAVATRRPT